MVLLKSMVEHGVDKIVFSSTAATYGEPERVPILEDDKTVPTNCYGQTKLSMEQMMEWVSRAHGLRYVALRYFNACGAHPSGKIGEAHNPETHLIPIILQVPLEQREAVSIFGDDYPTPDGTCRRDYLHVVDLAKGHLKAIDYAMEHTGAEAFNLGTGHAVSVLELVNTFMEATGVNVPYVIGPRREGDLPQMWADTHKAETVLGWKAEKTVADMCRDSWNWQSHNPDGYKTAE